MPFVSMGVYSRGFKLSNVFSFLHCMVGSWWYGFNRAHGCGISASQGVNQTGKLLALVQTLFVAVDASHTQIGLVMILKALVERPFLFSFSRLGHSYTPSVRRVSAVSMRQNLCARNREISCFDWKTVYLSLLTDN